MSNNVISKDKYGAWLFFVLGFSLLPIVVGIGIDLFISRGKDFYFTGVRVMDFLVCGFALVGGVICDRLNSSCQPSRSAVGFGFIFSVLCLVGYVAIRIDGINQMNDLGYVREEFSLVCTIFVAYLVSVIYSLIMLRKTLTEQNQATPSFTFNRKD